MNQVFELPLLELVDRVSLDWCIQHGTPWSRVMNSQEAKESATFGLALCHFATRLAPSSKHRDKLFRQGAGILDRCRYKPMLPDLLALLAEPSVKRSHTWTWEVNVALLNFKETATDAIIRSLPLKLSKNERLRDLLVVGLLKGEYRGEIPFEESCVAIVARKVLDGQVKFALAADQREAIKAAKLLLAKPATRKR